jgi:tRNA pseudouridine55 synthase
MTIRQSPEKRRPPESETNGLLLLKKNPGLTSFESLGMVKKALNTGKVGHTGTLDKFASGLLLVLTGRALKLTRWFSFCDKEYRGVIRFGIETDTLDPEGIPVGEGKIPSGEEVEAALPSFRGDILQRPPAYSAVHVDGKRAHKLARSGEVLEMKERPVTVYKLELLSWEPPFASVLVCCSAGTYIRSLARDIALAAGSRAYLSALARTRIGGFRLDDAFDPPAVPGGEGPDAGITASLAAAVKPITAETFDALGLPHVFAGDELARALVQGRLSRDELRRLDLPDGAGAAAVFRKTGGGTEELIAVLEKKSGEWGFGHVFARN